jgi:hypothetical protein
LASSFTLRERANYINFFIIKGCRHVLAAKI